jgi:hypothetical protein
MPASGFDRLFGDADGLLGSVFLDSAAPTLSAALLHHLVITLGLSLRSPRRRQLMVTGGQKRSANLIRPFIIGRVPPTSQLI